MDTFILLFKPCRAWLGRCLGLLVGVLLMTQHGWAQIYAASQNTTNFQYFDLATHTWTAKASVPTSIFGITAYGGKIYAMGTNTSNFYQYDPNTNTWMTKAAAIPSTITGGRLVTAGNYIYTNSSSTNEFSRYDPSTNSWTQMASHPVPASAIARTMAYDGGDYIYEGFNNSNTIARYSISGNTWTTINAPSSFQGITFKNGKLYLVNYTSNLLYSFDPGTNTYTQLANAPNPSLMIISGDGNYLYSNAYPSTSTQRYDISTNTWTSYTGSVEYAMVYMGPYCSVTGAVAAMPSTCASAGGANADAKLTLSTYSSNVTKVGYSAGSSYSGPAFASATAVTAAPMVLSNTLTNPSAPQPYTIRLYQDATCYKDVVATLAPTLCLTSDLSLSLSPAAQSGSKGELLTYTFMLTNAGPDAAADVQVDIKVPTNATLLTASPQLGTYSEATHKWEVSSLPVGAKTLTVTLKMN